MPQNKPQIIHQINDQIMEFSPDVDIGSNAKLHVGLNPFYITMRHEIHHVAHSTIEYRKQQLRKMLIDDFLDQNKQLSEVGLSYISAHR